MVILKILPHGDIGLAIILLTIIVKLITYPLSKKAAISQFEMRKHDKELQKIKEKHKNDREAEAVAIMNFYKTNKINPFSGILIIFIQIPIIYSLYYIFLKAGLPAVDSNLLYSFVSPPAALSMNFLGLLDVSYRNIYLALISGLTSFFQMKYSPASQASNEISGNEFKDNLSKAMSTQMKYFFPLLVFFISWKVSGAVALYWITSNILGLIQDYFIKKKLASTLTV